MGVGATPMIFARRHLLPALLLSLGAGAPATTAIADEQPISIVVLNFMPKSLGTASEASEAAEGRDIARTIAADLRSSGSFAPIGAEALGQTVLCFGIVPQFAPWRDAGVEYLVNGEVGDLPRGHIYYAFRLWNVMEGKLATNTYAIVPENINHISHVIADEIYARVTGQPGKFNDGGKD